MLEYGNDNSSFWLTCQKDFSYEQNYIIWVTTLTASIFSLFGSSFMISSYLFLDQGRRTWGDYFYTNPTDGINGLVALLAVGDLGWALNVITTYTYLLLNKEFNFPLCVVLRGWFQISAGSTVCWTFCISIFLYLIIFDRAKVFKHVNKIWFIFHVFSWGLPMICYCVLVASNQIVISQLGLCFPTDHYHFYFWFIPNIILFIATLFNYVILIVKVHTEQVPDGEISGSGFLKDLTLVKRVTLYLLIFLISWALDIIAYFIGQSTGCIQFVIVLIYSILLQLQGLFDALIYGLTSRGLRKQYYSYNFFSFIFFILISPFIMWPLLLIHIRKRCIGKKDQNRDHIPILHPSDNSYSGEVIQNS